MAKQGHNGSVLAEVGRQDPLAMRHFPMDKPRLASGIFLQPDLDNPRVASTNVGKPIVSAKTQRDSSYFPVVQDCPMIAVVEGNRACLDENDDFHPAERIQFAFASGL